MESLGKAFLKGYYKNGSIHTKDFSIRVLKAFPIIDEEEEHLFIGDVYLNSLEVPYVDVALDQDSSLASNNFINIFMQPTQNNCVKDTVTLPDGQIIWVDFRDIQEKCDGYYQCVLEFHDGIWYFVPKGVDKIL